MGHKLARTWISSNTVQFILPSTSDLRRYVSGTVFRLMLIMSRRHCSAAAASNFWSWGWWCIVRWCERRRCSVCFRVVLIHGPQHVSPPATAANSRPTRFCPPPILCHALILFWNWLHCGFFKVMHGHQIQKQEIGNRSLTLILKILSVCALTWAHLPVLHLHITSQMGKLSLGGPVILPPPTNCSQITLQSCYKSIKLFHAISKKRGFPVHSAWTKKVCMV